jgi:uncharacterized protein YbjT (DUF2867 family)
VPTPGPIAVIGGTGFIGRKLVTRLLAERSSVRVVARHTAAGDGGTRRGLELIAGDITDHTFAEQALHDVRAIVNLVGSTSCSNERTFYALHRDAPSHIARVARNLGVRKLVHVSAMGISVTAPAAADRSKAEGEIAVAAQFPEAAIVRPSLVYGRDDHFFGRFARLIRRSPLIPLIGGGRTRFEPMHVDDMVEGMLRILHGETAGGHVYGFGGPEVLSLRTLIERLGEALERKRRLLTVPFSIAEAAARLLERLPGTALTVDQVRLLMTDKVCDGYERRPDALGIRPRSLRSFYGHLSVETMHR